jgi:hypothetical protein
MSNLLDWNTLENKVKAYIDEAAGIDTPQKAFPILMVASILRISDEEASDAITDGPKDRGVDAIFIDENAGNCIHLFQFKYVDKFSNSNKNFPSGEIEKLESYVTAMLNNEAGLKKTCNPILWGKTQEIWETLKKPDVEFKLHFCGNLAEMLDDEQERAQEAFDKYRKFSVHHHSLKSIVDQFLDAKRPKIDRTIAIVDKDYFDRTDGSVRGLICSVEALEIVKMVDDPHTPGKIYDPIFNDNVRVYLSKNNKINKKIIASATSENSALFWYLNNGITITCDSFSYIKGRRAPQVELRNVQIVNGGQTTHALYEVFQENPDALDDILVLARIIETRSSEFGLSIAESTNSQTPIKGRDLRSNDEIQKKLEVSFSAIGYFYERKLNQGQTKPKNLRIDAIECAQAHVAYKLGLPEVAKKDRGRIFGDLYDRVFTDELSTRELLCSYLLMVEIDKLKKKVQMGVRKGTPNASDNLFLIDGAFHVLYALHVICTENGIDHYDITSASTKIPMASRLVKKIVKQAMKKDDAFSFNRFFKDARTKDLILEGI